MLISLKVIEVGGGGFGGSSSSSIRPRMRTARQKTDGDDLRIVFWEFQQRLTTVSFRQAFQGGVRNIPAVLLCRDHISKMPRAETMKIRPRVIFLCEVAHGTTEGTAIKPGFPN